MKRAKIIKGKSKSIGKVGEMTNYASKLGEAVGHAVEGEVQRIIREVVEPHNLFVDVGGARPGRREGKKLLMVNDTATEYQIGLFLERINHVSNRA